MADAQIRITADTSQAERALGSLNNTIKSLAAITIGTSLAKSLLDIASSSQELTNKLLSVSDNITEANVKFGILADTARRTGSNLGGTVDLFQKLAQSSTFAGSSTEALAGVAENFNKTLQISGASGQSAAAALYQFAQAMQKGTLNGDEFRTIQETNGYMLKILQQELGKSATELRQMASDGKLSAEVIAKALLNNNQIAQDYGKTIRTIPQAFENLQTSLMQSLRAFDEATGASDKFVAILELLANNMDTIIAVVGAFFAAFAVTRIIAIATAIYEIVKALEAVAIMEAIASGGLSLLAAGAAGAAAYFAIDEAMGKINEKHKEQKKAIDDANAAQNKGLVITHQRNQQALDLDKALKEQIASMNAMSAIDEKNSGLKSLQLEIERAISAEKVKYQKTGESMTAQQERDLANAVRRKVLADELGTVNRTLQELQSQSYTLSILDNNERAIAIELERQRLSLTSETFNLRKAEIENALRAKAVAEALLAVNKENADELARAQNQGILDPRARAIEESILKNRQQYGSAYTSELEEQDRILKAQIYDLQQQNQAAQVLYDLTRQRTDLEKAQAAASIFGQTKEGMAVELQKQFEGLDVLRQNDLISEQSYADQRVLIEQQAADRVLQYEQSVSAARMKQAGVTNDAIIKAVQDQQKNVMMIQQGGIVGAQGMLGALDNVMSSMAGQSKKAFEAHKALATAQAIISTYQAAAMAIAMPPGPPISFIYVAGAIAAGMAQVSAIQSQQYSGRALGGPVMSGTSYLVGERGPEIFTPHNSGSITRNDQLGGGNVSVNFTIVANDTTGFDALLNSRQGVIKQIISDAMLERGQRSMV